MNLTISSNRRKAEYVLNPVLRGYAESVAGVMVRTDLTSSCSAFQSAV
jgi:hypothetical protein